MAAIRNCAVFVLLLNVILALEFKDQSMQMKLLDRARKVAKVKRQTDYQTYLDKRNSPNYDARAENDWWNLYKFGNVAKDNFLHHDKRGVKVHLQFQLPFYGFKFDYAIVFPSGLVAFKAPEYQRYPKRFPVPKWPLRKDPGFIAPFYAESEMIHVGDERMSQVWYRVVRRYGQEMRTRTRRMFRRQAPLHAPLHATTPGHIIDKKFLNDLTNTIRENAVDAADWRADDALIVTWEMLAHGGAEKRMSPSDFMYSKDELNTFQLVLATDQKKTYAIMNYAALTWTTSESAGGDNQGLGGRQSAIVGFNGGNNTGFTPMPHSGRPEVRELADESNALEEGRWIYRIDEVVQPRGCSNEDSDQLVLYPDSGPVQGGFAVNVSGPCFEVSDRMTLTINGVKDTIPYSFISANRIQFIFPKFAGTLGWVNVSLNTGSQTYKAPFFINAPALADNGVDLVDFNVDIKDVENIWSNPDSKELTINWDSTKFYGNPNLDIKIHGYWKDGANKHHMEVLDHIAQDVANIGEYQFNPTSMRRNPKIKGAWKKVHVGLIEVVDPNNKGSSQWSKPTNLAWYNVPRLLKEYKTEFPAKMCDLLTKADSMSTEGLPSCPCDSIQANSDFGRFMPMLSKFSSLNQDDDTVKCFQSVMDMDGNRKTSQECCYNDQEFLLFSQYVTPGFSKTIPGTPNAAHSLGSYNSDSSWAIPTLSHMADDMIPREFCCLAGRCDEFYKKRQTDGCQNYEPATLGYAFGVSHYVTFDGTEYTFPGKGYFTLMQTPDIKIQVRLEQPEPTPWGAKVNATVITGIAFQGVDTDKVEIMSRKPGRSSVYKTDVYVNGRRIFLDKINFQKFNGLTLFENPPTTAKGDDRYIVAVLSLGVGIKINEQNSQLNVIVSLPPDFKEKCSLLDADCYMTRGLLGTFNGDSTDDFMTPDDEVIKVEDVYSYAGADQIYKDFGLTYDVTASLTENVLFDKQSHKAIFDPLSFFSSYGYKPMMYPVMIPLAAEGRFTKEDVISACKFDNDDPKNEQCYYDYMVTGKKDVAKKTLSLYNDFTYEVENVENVQSCGPLQTNPFVIRKPSTPTYLEGDVTEFSCPSGFTLQGTETRTCSDGKWSEGEPAYCIQRSMPTGGPNPPSGSGVSLTSTTALLGLIYLVLKILI